MWSAAPPLGGRPVRKAAWRRGRADAPAHTMSRWTCMCTCMSAYSWNGHWGAHICEANCRNIIPKLYVLSICSCLHPVVCYASIILLTSAVFQKRKPKLDFPLFKNLMNYGIIYCSIDKLSLEMWQYWHWKWEWQLLREGVNNLFCTACALVVKTVMTVYSVYSASSQWKQQLKQCKQWKQYSSMISGGTDLGLNPKGNFFFDTFPLVDAVTER